MRSYSFIKRVKEQFMRFNQRLLCSIVLLLAATASYAAPQNQDPTVSIAKKDTPLKSVLLELEKQTGFTFFYNTQQVDVQKKVSVNATNKRFSELLSELLSDENLQFRIMGKQIALYPKGGSADDAMKNSPQQDAAATSATTQQATQAAPKAAAQVGKKTIKGTVTSAEDGTPLEFISVVVRGTRDYAITGKDGQYSITTDKTDGTLEFSLIGYTSVEEPINGRSVVNAQIREQSNVLDGVVVTGYQTISKERVTGSFSLVNSDIINSQVALDLAASLEGRIAGVVKNADGSDFTIRGVSTMNAVASPLYVIDGFPVEGDSPSFSKEPGGTMLSYSAPKLNPEDIESVTVLKDAAAASIYGSRAANGVIVITTKKAKAGGAQVFFSADMTIKPVANYEERGYLSANDFINLEADYINGYPYLQNPATRAAEIKSLRSTYNISPTMDLMLNALEGKITNEEASRQIDAYRSNGLPPVVKDFMDEIYRPTINQRYYLSVGKAVEKNSFMGSVTYNDRKQNTKNNESNDLEFNLRNMLSVAKWLDVELNANILSSNDKNRAFAAGVGGSLGDKNLLPYTRLVDNDGNPLKLPAYLNPNQLANLNKYKDDLQNLDVILQEEQNYNIERSKGLRTRAAAKLNFKITSWLQFITGFQYEANYNKTSLLYNKESITSRREYDDYSYLSSGKVLHRIPYGDSFESTNVTTTNYTQRNQLVFNTSSKNRKHVITALAGTETRQIKGEREKSRVWNFDNELLAYELLDYLAISKISTSFLGGGLPGAQLTSGSFYSYWESLNRFVSLYGNASYAFNNRFDVSGSIRWDLSNLFGTNPDYQYRPFWSAGAAWNISQEKFMADVKWVNRLKLRLTYGINGNIAKTVSPYLIATYSKNPTFTSRTMGIVLAPPNENLRWERTQSTNLGIDFSLLKNKLSGSIDVYNKYSDDLLSNATIDPTYGFSSATLNVGAMRNRGVELDLRGVLLQRKDFMWTAGFTLAYNNNKITRLYYKPAQASDLYLSSSNQQEGYPINSMYSYRFAGIDEKGDPTIFDENGNRQSIKSVSNLNAVEFSGSLTPLYSGSIYSTASYKGIELSVNFIYNAGHVMRKQVSPAHLGMPNSLMTGNYSNSWQKPGDESNPNVTPRITYGYDSDTNTRNAYWQYSNYQVVSASYITMRSLTLSYSFSRILQHSFLKNLKLRGQVDNLFFLAANGEGSNPEAYDLNKGYRNTPIMPTYYLGLNLSF